jgi:hypothetical protein
MPLTINFILEKQCSVSIVRTEQQFHDFIMDDILDRPNANYIQNMVLKLYVQLGYP